MTSGGDRENKYHIKIINNLVYISFLSHVIPLFLVAQEKTSFCAAVEPKQGSA